jgi:hypothetical protein
VSGDYFNEVKHNKLKFKFGIFYCDHASYSFLEFVTPPCLVGGLEHFGRNYNISV